MLCEPLNVFIFRFQLFSVEQSEMNFCQPNINLHRFHIGFTCQQIRIFDFGLVWFGFRLNFIDKTLNQNV